MKPAEAVRAGAQTGDCGAAGTEARSECAARVNGDAAPNHTQGQGCLLGKTPS